MVSFRVKFECLLIRTYANCDVGKLLKIRRHNKYVSLPHNIIHYRCSYYIGVELTYDIRNECGKSSTPRYS